MLYLTIVQKSWLVNPKHSSFGSGSQKMLELKALALLEKMLQEALALALEKYLELESSSSGSPTNVGLTISDYGWNGGSQICLGGGNMIFL